MVTGVGQGIGLAIVKKFLSLGAKVFYIDKVEDRMEEHLKEFRHLRHNIDGFACDLSDLTAIDEVMKRI